MSQQSKAASRENVKWLGVHLANEVTMNSFPKHAGKAKRWGKLSSGGSKRIRITKEKLSLERPLQKLRGRKQQGAFPFWK